ncbi:hypothetical protein BH24ACT19_BH24ACT19_04230 [soil metagenome]
MAMSMASDPLVVFPFLPLSRADEPRPERLPGPQEPSCRRHRHPPRLHQQEDYRIYDNFVVDPTVVRVTEPIAGKNIVSFQTCFPELTFEKRLIVRGQPVSQPPR